MSCFLQVDTSYMKSVGSCFNVEFQGVLSINSCHWVHQESCVQYLWKQDHYFFSQIWTDVKWSETFKINECHCSRWGKIKWPRSGPVCVHLCVCMCGHCLCCWQKGTMWDPPSFLQLIVLNEKHFSGRFLLSQPKPGIFSDIYINSYYK